MKQIVLMGIIMTMILPACPISAAPAPKNLIVNSSFEALDEEGVPTRSEEAIIGDPPYTPAQVAARNRALINAKCPGCGAGTMSPGTVPRPVSPPVPGE